MCGRTKLLPLLLPFVLVLGGCPPKVDSAGPAEDLKAVDQTPQDLGERPDLSPVLDLQPGPDLPGQGDLVPDVRTWDDLYPEPPKLEPLVLPATNAIVGQVVDRGGRPLEGVEVSTGSRTVTTNYQGYYAISEIGQHSRLVLRFSHPSFATVVKSGVGLEDGRNTVNAVLLPRPAARGLDPSVKSRVRFPRGTVEVPAGALVDAQGRAPAGKPMVRMTPVDVSTPELEAAPGDFSATTGAGGEAQLETFAMAEFQVVGEDGQPLKIKEGEAVAVEMLLPEDTDLTEGQEVPMWHFDEASGKWTEEGLGQVQKYSEDDTRLAVATQVKHFSWWNCDDPMIVTCLSGRVLDCEGEPAYGAEVTVDSLDYQGKTMTIANRDGEYCVQARIDSEVRVIALWGTGQDRVAAVDFVRTTEGPIEGCTADCTKVDLQLPCDAGGSPYDCDEEFFLACQSGVQGKVFDRSGAPVRQAVVEVATGLTGFLVSTNNDGEFQVPVARGSLVTLQARTNNAYSGAITTEADEAGQCPDCKALEPLVLKVEHQSKIIRSDICAEDGGGLELTSLVANGAAPEFQLLDSGWARLTKVRDGQETFWNLELNFITKRALGVLFGKPWVHFSLKLKEAPSGPATFVLDSSHGTAFDYSGHGFASLGVVLGLGNLSMIASKAEGDRAGTVSFDGPVGPAGSSVTGRFQLRLVPDCALMGATLDLGGTFSTVLVDETDWDPKNTGGVDPAVYQACKALVLAAQNNTVGRVFLGSLRLFLDGKPVLLDPNEASLGDAYFSITNNAVFLQAKGREPETTDLASIDIKLKNPKMGQQDATEATLTVNYPNGECEYSGGTGTVTMTSMTDPSLATSWAGSFQVQFAGFQPSGRIVNCPPRVISGSFGIPVCQ